MGFTHRLCLSSVRTYRVPQTRDRLPRKSVQLYWGSDGHQICPNALYIDWTHQIYLEFLILDYFIKSVPTMFTRIINQLSVSKATTWSTLENCSIGLTVWVTVSDVYFSSELGRLECPPQPAFPPFIHIWIGNTASLFTLCNLWKICAEVIDSWP